MSRPRQQVTERRDANHVFKPDIGELPAAAGSGTALIIAEGIATMVYWTVFSVVAVLAIAATTRSAAAQTTGSCSDEVTAQASSPVVLHFDLAQTALRPDDEKKVAQLARLARSHQVQEICIQGFSDLRGDQAVNEQLSISRGHAVARALRKHGVNPQTIVIDPHGEPGTSIAGFLNEATGTDRRIEIRFTRY